MCIYFYYILYVFPAFSSFSFLSLFVGGIDSQFYVISNSQVPCLKTLKVYMQVSSRSYREPARSPPALVLLSRLVILFVSWLIG
jgi:hypothetical protein